MKQRTVTLIIVVLLAVAAFVAWEHGDWDISQLEAYIEEHTIAGSIACVGAFALSTVLPISALPLLPLAARVYGIWTTILLTATGWWIGCIAAFVIARWARVFLERVTSLEATRRLEAKLPADVGFSGIVVLRIVFPGDIVGFALGLLKHVRFSTYATASLIGTIPSAIVFSYAGGELGKGHYSSSALLVLAMVLATILLKRLWPDRASHREAGGVNEQRET
ncbi:MAG TPA: VTT domain-containing protein [Burkholderiales bacterium]|nr:VTT domain-containing protein [Burkholderiales bacterium]